MSKLRETIENLRQNSGIKYLLVGGTAFAFDYAMLMLTYYVFKLPLDLATSIGFFSGFIISFSMNRQWVFLGDHKKKIGRQIAEYVLLLIFNYFFTVLGVSFLNSHGIKPFIGKVIVMAMVVCWNYALFRWVIFVSKKSDTQSE